MIEFIHGSLAELYPTYAVIEAAGVGYNINIALTAYSTMVGQEGKEMKLYVTEIIREDTHDLYGFPTKGEREIFLLLTTVSGIGANTARMILSTYSAAEVRQIVATGNARALGQVKGLGPKTAQRIIVDLKDKMLKVDLGGDQPGGLIIENAGGANNEIREEALSALTMLGFAVAPSAKAVDKILSQDPTAKVEHIIRLALKML